MPIRNRPSTARQPRPANLKPLPPVAEGFPKRLYEARMRAGFDTQPKLAQAAGINLNTVSRHENGRHQPTIELLHIYAAALHVTVDYLQHGDTTPQVVHAYLRSEEGMALPSSVAVRLSQLTAVWWSSIVQGEVKLHHVQQVAAMMRDSRPAPSRKPQARRPAEQADLFASAATL